MNIIVKTGALFALSSMATASMAGDCTSRQLPDGTWTTECPSESVAPPLLPVSSNFTTVCATDAGTCRVTFSQYQPQGASCYCTANDKRVYGKVNNRAARGGR